MTDQQTTPAGTPASDTSGAGGNSFVRDRARQMEASTQRPGMPHEPAARPEDNPRARGHSPAQDARQQQQAPVEQKIKVGDVEYTAADLESAIAERAERASARAQLPSSADGYEIKLPDGFQAPEGVRFEFNAADPALKAFRDVAHRHGISQEVFSDALAVFASTKMGEAITQSTLRETNLKQLGAAGPQRIEAVATWLQARAGAEGRTMANFLRQFPSAPIVKTMESLMRAFSSQGGADFSQSHRAGAEDNSGKIPGYEGMSFTQKRVAQMQRTLNPGGSRRDRRGA